MRGDEETWGGLAGREDGVVGAEAAGRPVYVDVGGEGALCGAFAMAEHTCIQAAC